MRDHTMTINGRAVAGKRTIEVVNPATGKVFAEAPDCTREQLDDAMQGAKEAFPAWRDNPGLRTEVMLACADAIDAAAEELSLLQTLEQGMPLDQSRGVARACANSFRRYADLQIPAEVIQDDGNARIEVVRRALGVIAVIKPWNFPLVQATTEVAPAFRAGNTVVMKPSPYTPLSTLAVGELLREIVPAGALSFVSGGDQVGQWMVEHPVPRGVSFTGSVASGKLVASAASADLKRLLLELGGNDPAIVLPDVDPGELAGRLFWTAFRNAGQVCIAVKRAYVPESLHGAVVDALAERARAVKVGNGLDDGVEIGPISNAMQFERVKGLVADAIAGGATAVTGGRALDGPGYFYEPTILTGVREGSRIVDEEQFGPVLPVMSYRTVEEALERANATSFGLGASVWSADPARAWAVAQKLESGSVWVNTHDGKNERAPVAGMKWSGVGAKNGLWSILAYTDPQAVWLSRSGPTTYPAASQPGALTSA